MLSAFRSSTLLLNSARSSTRFTSKSLLSSSYILTRSQSTTSAGTGTGTGTSTPTPQPPFTGAGSNSSVNQVRSAASIVPPNAKDTPVEALGRAADTLGSNSNDQSVSSSGVANAAARQLSGNGGNGNGDGNGGQKKKKTGFFRKVKRATYVVLLSAAGTFVYFVYDANHPPAQLPFEDGKKRIVILGSGWGATSVLKSIDTEHYSVTVISPHNYFLFTPLLPSVTVGTLNGRSIAQPTRHTTRRKTRAVQVLEAEATHVDVENKTVSFEDKSAESVASHLGVQTIPFDYLIYAVGSQNQTFGIEGINKHACFLKELGDAEKIRNKLMDCIETAAMAGQTPEEIDRLLTCAVVGGGPTGIEYAAELRDFVQGDISKWYPELQNKFKVLLIEAMPSVLPMFSSKLVEYTMKTFKDNDIEILTRHQVKDCGPNSVLVKSPSGEDKEIPFGLLVWAAGNTLRPLSKNIISQLSEHQTERRGLKVDDHLRLAGAEDSIYALGDATATPYAPTAQAASQQGAYLGRIFNQLARVEVLEEKLEEAKRMGRDEEDIKRLERQISKASRVRPFKYSHQGSLAYIGSHNAVADLPFGNGSLALGGVATYYLWRSAYASMLFGLRCRSAVLVDWCKVWLFGRDVSRE